MAMKRSNKNLAAPKTCTVVIRVAVPVRDAPNLKIQDVFGIDSRGNLRDLQILSAYYDRRGQPDAKF